MKSTERRNGCGQGCGAGRWTLPTGATEFALRWFFFGLAFGYWVWMALGVVDLALNPIILAAR